MRRGRSVRQVAGSFILAGMVLAGILSIGVLPSSGDVVTATAKLEQIQTQLPPWVQSGGDLGQVIPLIQSINDSLGNADLVAAERSMDQILALIAVPVTYTPPPGPYLTAAATVKLGALPSTARLVAHSGRYIYVMDENGQNVTEITFEHPRPWEHVAVSYNHRYIVANELPDATPSQSRMWLLDLQGGTEAQLLPQFYTGGEGGVSWDSNGFIYFVGKTRQSDNMEVFRIKFDGTGLARLTNTPGSGKYDVGISQDGTMITYVVSIPDPDQTSAHTEIWVANSDGSNQRRVYTAGTVSVASAHDPELAPGNSRVVFSQFNTNVPPNFSDNPAANTAHDLWVCDLDGQNLQRLTVPGPISIIPNWQPGGNLIAYTEVSEAGNYAGASIVNGNLAEQTPTQVRRGMSAVKWIPPLGN